MSKFLCITVLIVAGAVAIVNHAQAQESPFFPVEQQEIAIDASTALKGVRLPMVGTGAYITILPGALSGPVVLRVSRDVPMNTSVIPYPYRHTPASAIVSFELDDPAVYTGVSPFIIELPFASGSYYPKYMYRVDEKKELWMRASAGTPDAQGTLRVDIRSAAGRVGVFEHTGLMSVGRASWYRFKACDCSASPDFPKGTRLKVTNLENGASVVVTVNDWGPERDIFPDRVVDLDATAFAKIGRTTLGTLSVSIEPLPPATVKTANES